MSCTSRRCRHGGPGDRGDARQADPLRGITGVEFQGKRYSPENLQLGQRVEIDLRDDRGGSGGQRRLAREIVVVGREPTENH